LQQDQTNVSVHITDWWTAADIAIYPFSRWRSAILDLWGKFWDDPQREFGDHRAKFGWNRISHFDNTKFCIFCDMGIGP